jgi:glycosidase
MFQRRIILLLSLFFIAFIVKVNAQFNEVIKPLILDQNNSIIHLQDFITDVASIDSVILPKHFRSILSKDKLQLRILNIGAKVPYVSTMRIYAKGKQIDCALFKSSKMMKPFQIDDPLNKYKSISLAGDFNSWSATATPMKFLNGKWVAYLNLNPGIYHYQIIVDGKWKLDFTNQDSVPNGLGAYHSIVRIGRDKDVLPHLSTFSFTDKQVVCKVDRNRIEKYFVFFNNTLLDSNKTKLIGNQLQIQIPIEAISIAKSSIRVYCYNAYGRGNDVLVPLVKGKVQSSFDGTDFESMNMYYVLVDRFNNGNIANDKPISDKDISKAVNFQGGDLAGITTKIKDGYFDKLGINCISISPIVQNPENGFIEYAEPHRKYSGYDGGWPISFTKIDRRFGTEAELFELIHLAHSKNIKVLLDFVSNHVHQEHPIVKTHPDWLTPMALPNGKKNIRLWDEHKLETWYEAFLPDIDYRNKKVIDAITDSAVWWIKKFDFDGFRHDATDLVSEEFWRQLTLKVKTQVEVPRSKNLFQIGESSGSREQIGSYINNGEQEAQFDFNTYFDARSAFADSTTSFESLAKSLEFTFQCYGSHHLMGNMSGNNDLPRFISYASGALSFKDNDRVVSWQKQVKVESPIGYKRLAQLIAFNVSIPGIPVIYFGDEFGMPGAGIPDNRRLMQFAELNAAEINNLEISRSLFNLRKSSPALILGDTRILLANKTSLVILRNYFGNYALCVFNKSSNDESIEIDLPYELMDIGMKANFGSSFEKKKSKVKLQLHSNSFEILTN